MHGTAGGDQVAHSGQTGEGILPPPKGHPQPGHLRQTPGYKQGLGIVAIAHAVAAAGAQGNDVFQRGADLGANPVAAGVYPEAGIHKQVLNLFRSRQVLGGRYDPGGDMPAYLLGVGGPGEDHNRARDLLLNDLAQQQRGVLLDTLGHRHQDGPRVHQPPEPLGRGPHGEGGRSHHHQPAVPNGGQIAGEFQLLGQGDALQHGALPGILEGFCFLLRVGPQGDIAAILRQQQRQRRPPRAAAQDCDFHSGFLPDYDCDMVGTHHDSSVFNSA